MFESFNQYIGGNPASFPKTTSPTPNRPLFPAAGILALLELPAEAQRQATITFLQDNIVPLVGPDAARALAPLLDQDAADDFVQKALTFQMYLERGLQTSDEAMEAWRSMKGQ